MTENIKDALRNPLGVAPYKKGTEGNNQKNDSFQGLPPIKVIFIGEYFQDKDGEHFNIAFQRFRKEQNLSTLPHRFLLSEDTFVKETKFEFGIRPIIDCYVIDEELQFFSFYFAKQVFDLTDYYRSASAVEVLAFTKNAALKFEDADAFTCIADNYIRRKIAMINDSHVLEKFTAQTISTLAKKSGISIKVQSKQIVIPSDKKSAKAVLAFLDEELYLSPFTNSVMIANSKRVLRKA
ncbi:Kiwa anti-phage protein KwaB-like domain-containing protein [Succinivibrio dextrinosolvens]|uniref:Kiwa anti-phage protein KwaB-like domain-containing protein n=1 Tax=Succinivibrio dextrinosolvens TaxID=83771 RepID=UPI0019208328|nr:Kiwa anti-phage protein KwaB-like domain-containing protein [Succinivibrio dextrinosolvens]